MKEDESGELDYLDGELWFSKELASRQLDFKITLVSTDSLRTYKNLSDGNIANLRIHPNLLYITRYDDIRKSGDLHQAKRLFDQGRLLIKHDQVYLNLFKIKSDFYLYFEAFFLLKKHNSSLEKYVEK